MLRLEVETHLKRFKEPLWITIDEIQKVASLLNEVHDLIESGKGKTTFLLTGSSERKLKRSGANLLAGRAITKKLHPLSSREIDLELSRALQFGTMPKIYLEHDLEIERLDTYVTTYLREEIQEEALVRQTEKFSRFLELAAQHNGEPINFSKLAKQFQVSTKTCQEYFEILVDTLLVQRIDGWDHSIKKQLLKAPKFYFFDCGVLNAINGELRTELRPSSFRYGRLFETMMIQEIIRLNDEQNLGFRLNYWRDSQGREVDLILSRSTSKPIAAIEIKSSSMPQIEDLRSLALVAEEYPQIRKVCLCLADRLFEIGGIEVFPFS